jgi:hypothetical protein
MDATKKTIKTIKSIKSIIRVSGKFDINDTALHTPASHVSSTYNSNKQLGSMELAEEL